MKGDIALAGFVLTADEWEALDPLSRAQLISAAAPHEPWVVANVAGVLAEGSVPTKRHEDL